jgi:hypothetical protein
MAEELPPGGSAESAPAGKKKRRPALSQEDVPAYSLDQALRIPRAIASNYAFRPTRPLNVAQAVNMSPTSGAFRMLTGSAIAYGLTTGGYNASEIGLTPLGTRIVRPVSEGDDTAAMREALLKPRVAGEFLRTYDGAALPPENIAKNVLMDRGVPAERLGDVYELIMEGARAVGFLREFGGKTYVDLAGAEQVTTPTSAPHTTPEVVSPAPAAPLISPAVSLSPGVHINLEIHIAADASSQVIEDIFRNMRRYVLSGDGQPEGDGEPESDGQTEAE